MCEVINNAQLIMLRVRYVYYEYHLQIFYIKFFNLLWFQKSSMNPVLKARSNSPSPDSYTRWWIEHGKSNISENMTAFVNISRLMTNSETLVASLSKSDQAAHSLFSGYWQPMYFYQNHNFCGMCLMYTTFKKGKIQSGIFEMMQCFARFSILWNKTSVGALCRKKVY